MIRGDILRTKTAQVSAEHRREASHLGALREREDHARNGVQRREERFWREVSQASVLRSEARRAQGSNASIPITRALEAHRLLKKAKEEHSQLAGEVRTQVTRVLKAKVALDAFSKMQRRERTQREHRCEERLGEEIAEIQTSQKICHDRSHAQPRCDRIHDESGGSVKADHRVPVSESLALCAVHTGASERGTTLQVHMESSGTPVACHLASTEAGGVGVVVQAPRGELVRRLERERVGIVTKLSELGIKISSLQVRRESGLGHFGGGFLRRGRRTQEERDESTIA